MDHQPGEAGGLTKQFVDIAQLLSYQTAIYHLLTKDLPENERMLLELKRKRYFLLEMIHLESYYPVSDRKEFLTRLQGELGEIEEQLSELGRPEKV